MAVLDRIEQHVGKLLAVGVTEDGQLQHIRSGPARPKLNAQALAELVVLAPQRQPVLEQLFRHFGLHKMLNLSRSLAHRLGGRGAPRRCGQCRVAARPADEGLRGAVGGFDQSHLALQARQREHAVLTQSGGELLRRHTVHLMPAVGHEVEDEAHLAEFLGEGPHLVIGHAGGVPVERRRQVVGHHRLRVHRVNRLGELAGFGQVGSLGFHPQQIRKRCRGKRFRDRVGDAAANLVVTLRGPGSLAVPRRLHPDFGGLALGGVQRRGPGEVCPLGRLHR